MSQVKEWLLTEQRCIVCTKGFYPSECLDHEIDIGAPTCSKQCYEEYHQVMNALADMQEATNPLPSSSTD